VRSNKLASKLDSIFTFNPFRDGNENGLKKVVIKQKPTYANQTEWEELDEKTLSTIQLCLTNNVLQEVLMEKDNSGLMEEI
ncbi:hypothetical protein Golax_026030, partial [Gossypium laxum]|nr:hypothetical protein [Gossypium laxum]